MKKGNFFKSDLKMHLNGLKNQTFSYFSASPFLITPCIVRWGGEIADREKADGEKK